MSEIKPVFYFKNFEFTTWLIEIQQSDWSVAVVLNSVDHSVENHVLKPIEMTIAVI